MLVDPYPTTGHISASNNPRRSIAYNRSAHSILKSAPARKLPRNLRLVVDTESLRLLVTVPFEPPSLGLIPAVPDHFLHTLSAMSPLAFSLAAGPTAGLSAISGTALPERGCDQHAPATAPASRPSTPSMMAGRKFLVGGNWKANTTKKSIADLLARFNPAPAIDKDHVEVVVAPPFPYLERTRAAMRADFDLGAQNCWTGPSGAYTGETTADMLLDTNTKWVILGHSERRHLPAIKERDDVIVEKALFALSKGLNVIFCIGELLEEREGDHTMDVCVRQLAALTKVVAAADWEHIVIAYEPVWAIGTGKVATPDQAEEVHCAVRKWIADNVSSAVSESVRILYGGSVSGSNCKDLARLPDIDGFLVGGCSLKAEFLDIIESYKIAKATTV
jgi:triosephosphate isomerase (TIM)